jgi:adenylate cyclase, class 2
MSRTKKQEIEVKYYLGQKYADVRRRIFECGWVPSGSQKQTDTYYTSRFRDFIATEECLRIRCAGDYEELTWKPPTSKEMKSERQYWKEELNVDITSQSRIVSELLSHLDFVEYVTVAKQRELFRVDTDTLVSLDLVSTLGWFVEIETFFAAGREAEGVARNRSIADELGLGSLVAIDSPYRDLVKQGWVEETVR